ncbi:MULTISPECIES: phosphatase PAP2 family protein [unclassified Clostridium]|uniref:phosphatase PAP2 family protein n=1 Tax=unclassified Clostridium TaxID=2614128 RepID=UPI002911B6FB|nr:phosphatase PAP2 family protein [Clostridium sp.]MDU5105835.1 phosphatase PAP2 family protein [Clostridium sp.]
MLEIISNLDINILNFIRDNLSNAVMDKIMVVITSLGDKGLIWIVMALILLAVKKYRKIGIILLISLLMTSLLGEGIVKNIVQRPRAFITYPDISIIINPPTSFSFPSGHTASSFAAAVVLGHYFKKWSFLFYFLATLIAFSRLYLFVHYPSDIIVGIALGTICGLLTIKLLDKTIKLS